VVPPLPAISVDVVGDSGRRTSNAPKAAPTSKGVVKLPKTKYLQLMLQQLLLPSFSVPGSP